MATYPELFDLRTEGDLRNKIDVAVTIKAKDLIDLPTPTAEQIAWANEAIANSTAKVQALYNYVLAKNSAATVEQITSAADAVIQSHVNNAVDALIAGGA